MGLEQQDIDDGNLVDKSVALKLLSYSCADRGNGHGDVVHGLDLGSLESAVSLNCSRYITHLVHFIR